MEWLRKDDPKIGHCGPDKIDLDLLGPPKKSDHKGLEWQRAFHREIIISGSYTRVDILFFILRSEARRRP